MWQRNLRWWFQRRFQILGLLCHKNLRSTIKLPKDGQDSESDGGMNKSGEEKNPKILQEDISVLRNPPRIPFRPHTSLIPK